MLIKVSKYKSRKYLDEEFESTAKDLSKELFRVMFCFKA